MNFYLSNLKETLEAINAFVDKNALVVNTKRVRAYNHISKSDRSKINFIWRSLRILEREGILKKIDDHRNGANYKIISGKVDISQFLNIIVAEREKKASASSSP